MRKSLHYILLFLLFGFLSIQSNAQNVLWAQKGSSEGFENGNAIASDDSGNVYVTGQFEFTSTFSGVIMTSYGQHDIFVAKYSASGSLLWIKKAGGTDGDIGLGIGIDAQHNVYVTGEIETTARFSSSTTLTSAGENDFFLAKYDVNGNFKWAKRFGTSASEKGRAVAVSPSGNVYVTGNFANTITAGSVTLSTHGGDDIFVIKYNTNGNVDWAKRAGGGKRDRGYGIAIDASENVYVTGSITSPAYFNSLTVTNSGAMSSFVAKYNSAGTIQWVKAGGTCCDTTQGNGIVLDPSGNIYITGYFAVKTKFSSITLNSSGGKDLFVVKYNNSGSVQWAKKAGSSQEDMGNGIAYKATEDRIFVTGSVESAGQAGSLSYNFSGYKDVLIGAYSSSGNEKWFKTYGGTRRDIGLAICINSQGYIYSTGLFNGTASFGPITLTGFTNSYWADFYVAKIQPPAPFSPDDDDFILREINSSTTEEDVADEINADVFPNPFEDEFTFRSQSTYNIEVYDLFGRVVFVKKDVSGIILIGKDFSAGQYILRISDREGVKTKTVRLIKNN